MICKPALSESGSLLADHSPSGFPRRKATSSDLCRGRSPSNWRPCPCSGEGSPKIDHRKRAFWLPALGLHCSFFGGKGHQLLHVWVPRGTPASGDGSPEARELKGRHRPTGGDSGRPQLWRSLRQGSKVCSGNRWVRTHFA